MTPQCKSTLAAWNHIYKTHAQKGGIGHDPVAAETIKVLQTALREQAAEVHAAKAAIA